MLGTMLGVEEKNGGSPLSGYLQSTETDIEQIIKQAVGFPHGSLLFLAV